MCWKCGHAMTHSTSATGGTRTPRENEIALCLNCGALYFRHTGTWKPATSIEIATLSWDEKRMIEHLQRVREAAVNVDLSKKEGRA
jgi:hypothetical protein